MIHFVVHEEGDSVGTTLPTRSDIPIGHKVALRDLEKDDTVIKYGVDIGRVVAPIKMGEHLHVHNVKTKRW
jgi:(2R)-sulfolactate sulfo-lyase subunit alpha